MGPMDPKSMFTSEGLENEDEMYLVLGIGTLNYLCLNNCGWNCHGFLMEM